MGLSEDLEALLALLEELDVPHMVVGGLALDALASPRSTFGVDVQVRLEEPPSSTSSYFHGWFLEERAQDEVFDQDTLSLRHGGSPYPVELFLTTHWLPLQALDRRMRVHSDRLDRDVPIPTPEDFILLTSSKHTSRSRAKAAQDAVDRSYIQTHGETLGLWVDLQDLF